MSESVIIAIISAAAALGTALFSALGVAVGVIWRKLVNAAATNNALWTYTRVLIHSHYVNAKMPPPPPPEHIAHLYKTGEST